MLISASQPPARHSANTARPRERAGVSCDMPVYSPGFRQVLIPACTDLLRCWFHFSILISVFFGWFSADKIRRQIRLSAAAWGSIYTFHATTWNGPLFMRHLVHTADAGEVVKSTDTLTGARRATASVDISTLISSVTSTSQSNARHCHTSQRKVTLSYSHFIIIAAIRERFNTDCQP